jgi:hypothetical protein
MPEQMWRKVLLVVLVPIASILVVLSVITLWAHRTLTDTQTWVETVSRILDDPAVVEQLSTDLAAQIGSVLRLEDRVAGALPEQASFLAAPIADAAKRLVQTKATEFLGSDAGQRAWTEANRIGHEQMLTALRGESQLLTTANGTVTFDLSALPTAILQRLDIEAPGLLASRGQVPDPASGRSVEDRRRELARALGVEIPADFGQVPLFPASQLDNARRALQAFDALSVTFPVVTIALALAVVFLARNRWAAGLALCLGALVAFVLALALLPDSIPLATSTLPRTVGRDLAAAILRVLIYDLFTVLALGALVSAVAAVVVGFLTWLNRMSTGGEPTRKPELATSS